MPLLFYAGWNVRAAPFCRLHLYHYTNGRTRFPAPRCSSSCTQTLTVPFCVSRYITPKYGLHAPRGCYTALLRVGCPRLRLFAGVTAAVVCTYSLATPPAGRTVTAFCSGYRATCMDAWRRLDYLVSIHALNRRLGLRLLDMPYGL